MVDPTEDGFHFLDSPMSSSIESTFENKPVRPGASDSARLDLEKTVIRQGNLIDVHSEPHGSAGASTFRNDSKNPTDLLIGQQLDHFSIESLIGTGGMGAVFRGRDLRLDRVVAIKVVPIADRGAEAMRRFRFEAQSAAKLDHPNIARVYYVGETEQWSYIVFEFVEGTNLRELVLRQGLLSIDDAVCVTRQVAEALQHAFERKVVHRDIKPSNILVTQTGQAKLVDMGLARTTELDKSTNDLTASGVTLGTFDYISPEQAHDPRNADVRSDIYSLGCTLYFLMTGQPPFPEGTALQKLLLHGTKLPEDPRYFRSDISDSMIAILRKMMAKKPTDRYQEPCDLIHDLRTLSELEGLIWSQSSDNVAAQANPSQRTWLEASVPFLIALAAIFGVGFWLWLQSISYESAVFAIPREEIPEDAMVANTVGASSPDSSKGIQASSDTRNAANTALSAPDRPSAVSDSATSSSSSSKTDLKLPIEPVLIGDAITVNPLSFQERDRNVNVVRTLEQALEIVNTQPQFKRILFKGASVTTSLSALRSSIDLEADVVMQSESGQRCKWIIEGFESPIDSIDSLVFFDCHASQLLLQDIDIEWRVSSASRNRSLFAVHPGAWLQMKNCTVTVKDVSTPLSSSPYSTSAMRNTTFPSVVSVEETQQAFQDEVSPEKASKPARVFASGFSVRGQCDWLQLKSLVRTEVQLENGWLAISGAMFETSGSRTLAKSSVPLRIEMRDITSYTLQPWMVCNLSISQPYPIPMVRIARECVFAGCSTLIEWNASDCQDWKVWEQSEEGNRLLKWIDLRGVDNTYDDSTMNNYLLVKMTNGMSDQISLDSNPMLVSDERGLETEAAWKKRPVFDSLRIHEATVDSFEWLPRSFQPGFQLQP
jgi:serine/threonine protein kinase